MDSWKGYVRSRDRERSHQVQGRKNPARMTPEREPPDHHSLRLRALQRPAILLAVVSATGPRSKSVHLPPGGFSSAGYLNESRYNRRGTTNFALVLSSCTRLLSPLQVFSLVRSPCF